MAENTATEQTPPQIELVDQDQTEGYCDLVSGVCVLPGAEGAAVDEKTTGKVGGGRRPVR
ncbi:hypothetical protein [Streptomyces shenzhenensis]|uniref:hypothetical protein n=1 Tax=Streptomyces shenzhenensis TaxID=943815 RepID=UPI0033FFF154